VIHDNPQTSIQQTAVQTHPTTSPPLTSLMIENQPLPTPACTRLPAHAKPK